MERARRAPRPPREAGRLARSFWPVVVGLQTLVVVLHLGSLVRPHVEGDEVVFVFLAERLRGDPLAYHLQGALEGDAARRFIDDTWVPRFVVPGDPSADELRRFFARMTTAAVLLQPLSGNTAWAYDPAIYDRPLFVHPPLYPLALAAARALAGSPGGPLLAIAFHVATIGLVARLGRWAGGAVLGLVAAGVAAIDPILWQCGERLGIDGMAAMLAAGAVAAALSAARDARPWRWAVAGGVFALACLAKLTAMFVAPAIVAVWVLAPRRPSAACVAAFAATALVPLVGWATVTRAVYGAWLPRNETTEWAMQNYPYVRLVANRPWHFYLTGLLLTAPLVVLAPVGAAAARASRRLRVPAVWAVGVVLPIWTLGALGWGGGFQLRYLAPAVPAMALLVAAGILRVGRPMRVVVAALALVTFFSGWATSQIGEAADPAPMALGLGLPYVGTSLRELLPGFW